MTPRLKYFRIFTQHNVQSQSVTLALALSEIFINEHSTGACRIHGGGFAGTIQVFVPDYLVAEYIIFISNIFGADSYHILSFREFGAICLNRLA